jgi:hypothetical protein
MPLNSATLKTEIDTAYAAANTDYASSSARDNIKEGLIKAVAEAVVAHIQANAVVSTTTAGQIVAAACTTGGVVSGVNGASTGTGTGTVA